ncbi:restriction endonuclease [Curtobacterium caseinilyticum]|uniref:Restriction endonuclease n=1 Tax=Curtobacterium caseinilyticum TaxID=3055137 RepID=A0ABT7TVR2_9MICO|nr:restriction endonuclease [Curtobacterium caseinilyticum]MDM7892979.1 restriction endonuclease [Curtobacterium caseinilyticum]
MSDTEPSLTFLLDWQAAELAAVEHMKALGFVDAQKTQSGADGGIDVESSEAAAQVKFYASSIGRPDIQRLRGAAHEYRISVFYSTGGYTREAVQYADQAAVALFAMDPYGQVEAASEFAVVLADSTLVQERRERFEELKAVRYRFAADSLDRDAQLYAQFGRLASMGQEEGAVFTHAAAAFESYARAFRTAALAKDFAAADEAFDEANKRIRLLRWITGNDLRDEYGSLEDAVSIGWEWEVTPGSDHLLQRVSMGAFNLRELVVESFEGWESLLPEDISTHNLADIEMGKYAGMLLSASYDPALLTPDLLRRLKEAVRAGVQRTHGTAAMAFRALFDANARLGLGRPSSLLARSLRVDALVNRLYQQLDAS